ncbi:MAG: AbiV family abortive infection protein [Alphaproteobacteria bacterium]|nr:AbiV family abortive infection protein [Alphaproteobacteria bacterium]
MSVSSAASPHTLEDLEAYTRELLTKLPSTSALLNNIRDRDHKSYIELHRAVMILSRVPEFAERMSSDLQDEAFKAGIKVDYKRIRNDLEKKDSFRRFKKFADHVSQSVNKFPSLLSGTDFDKCLMQYNEIIAHVENNWYSACNMYNQKNYHLASFIAILVIEEIGKLARIFFDLLSYDVPRPARGRQPVERNHRLKHVIGVVSGALVNARLDRVLGKNVVRKVLNKAESGELEKIRQDCLYIDVRGGRTVTPRDLVVPEDARVLVVLAGELMADSLGHFPWEYTRMLDAVIAFERAIGMPDRKIAQRVLRPIPA